MTTSIDSTSTTSVANPAITAPVVLAKSLGVHPAAELFPLMKDTDFAML